ncbi:DNA repair protein RecO [bacterium]|nr:DNA repair protein RecO [bacterium]
MPTFKMEGTVLAKRPFGESDAMVDVLTISRGLETFVARGAFRSRRRLVGGLEPFTRAEFSVYQSRPGKLPLIQDLKVLVSRFALYRNLDDFTRLTDAAAFLMQVLPRGVPEYEVFDLFEALLAAACEGGRADCLTLSFHLRAFSALGWKLDVGACAVCRKMPAIDGPHELDLSSGRIRCPACRSDDPHPPAGLRDRITLSLDQARALSALVLPPRLKAGLEIDARHERFIRTIFHRYMAVHTGVDFAGAPNLTSRGG